MSKMLPFDILVLGILSLSSLSMAFAEMMPVVGVARGDVFNYGYTCYFNSNDSHAVPPASFSWINQTGYYMVNVTDVSGASITLGTLLHGLNGSNSLGICNLNIDTGAASISGYVGPVELGNFYCMARGVGMMGRMFPSAGGSPTINDTALRRYAVGERLTNHFVTTKSTVGGMMLESDFYFDQVTGMMVEWHQQTIQTNGNLQTNSTQIMRINSSSVWVVPEFPASIVSAFVVSIFVATSVVLIISKLRGNSKRRFLASYRVRKQ
jgi:hypothetical protein